MLKGIDHIVIAVQDMAAARQVYTDIGFTVVEGGKHPTGSFNNLIAFKDGSYIELLAFYEASPDHAWWDALHQRGGGLIDYCMQTDDIRADHAKLRELGAKIGDLTPLSRERPDGYELSWINNKSLDEHQGLVPFIIEDETPREERVPKETTHANGATGIHTLTLNVPDLSVPEAIFGGILGTSGKTVERDDLKATGLVYTVGEHQLQYLSPKSSDSPLQKATDANNPIPWSVVFTTTGEAQPMHTQETMGVRMAFVTKSKE